MHLISHMQQLMQLLHIRLHILNIIIRLSSSQVFVIQLYLIENDLLSEKFVEGQGLFNYNEVLELKNRLRSNNVGDAAAKVWALIVFQWWWKRNMNLYSLQQQTQRLK